MIRDYLIKCVYKGTDLLLVQGQDPFIQSLVHDLLALIDIAYIHEMIILHQPGERIMLQQTVVFTLHYAIMNIPLEDHPDHRRMRKQLYHLVFSGRNPGPSRLYIFWIRFRTKGAHFMALYTARLPPLECPPM